jgi:serine protease Do
LPEGVAKTGPAKFGWRDLRRLAAVGVLGVGLVIVGLTDRPVPASAQLKVGSPAETLSFANIVEQVKPAVVSISATNEVARVADNSKDNNSGKKRSGPRFEGIPGLPEDHPLNELFKNLPKGMPQQQQPRQAAGSGFIISPDGYIVTNRHVIDGSTKFKVSFDNQEEFDAELKGADERTDIALLKIDPKKPLTYVKFAEKQPRVGDWVLAVGNPFGLGGTVTAGIVSALARNIGGPYDYMQIDAAVNHGNSGGPAFNLEGDVVGVNTAIYSPTGGSVGIAFAVPSDTVKRVVEQLEKGGSVSRGWLGVRIQEVDKDLADSLGLKEPKGAIISEVLADGPAAGAGLKVADAIVKVNDKKIDDPRDLQRTIADLPAKSDVDLTIWRDKSEHTMKVKLGTYQAKNEDAQSENQQDEPKEEKSSNVDLKQLGLTLKPAGTDSKEGVVIADVDPNSQSADKGLKEGDVIVKAGNESVSSPQDVLNAVKKSQTDGRSSVMFHVKKGGDQTVLVAVPLKKG